MRFDPIYLLVIHQKICYFYLFGLIYGGVKRFHKTRLYTITAYQA